MRIAVSIGIRCSQIEECVLAQVGFLVSLGTRDPNPLGGGVINNIHHIATLDRNLVRMEAESAGCYRHESKLEQ